MDEMEQHVQELVSENRSLTDELRSVARVPSWERWILLKHNEVWLGILVSLLVALIGFVL